MAIEFPAKKFKFGKDCRDSMFAGIDLMRRAVTATLGPNGRNVCIDRRMIIDITKDGVTALADVAVEDAFEEMGCKQVREASTKTNDEAGDGTTTAIEVAWAACNAARGMIGEGTNVIKMQKGMEIATDLLAEELDKMAIKAKPLIPVQTAEGAGEGLSDEQKEALNEETQSYVYTLTPQEMYEHVATISAQDEKTGKKVAEIFMESGENGVIDIERVDKPGIETEHTKGMKLGEGFMRPEFINDYTNISFGVDDCAVVVPTEK